MQQGDPGANPSRFSYNSVLAANTLGGFCLFLVVLLWLYDAVAVARGARLGGFVHEADWLATFCHLAGVAPARRSLNAVDCTTTTGRPACAVAMALAPGRACNLLVDDGELRRS